MRKSFLFGSFILLSVLLFKITLSNAADIEEILEFLEREIAIQNNIDEIVINANISNELLYRNDLEIKSFEAKNSVLRAVLINNDSKIYKIAGSYDKAIKLPMLDIDLAIGGIIKSDNIVMMKWQKRHNNSRYIQLIQDLEGMQVRSKIKAYHPISNNQLERVHLIKKGHEVNTKFVKKGLVIANKMEAIDNGGINDTIKLRTKSGKIISGVVHESGEVFISNE